jgi:hypothetical protein
MGAPARVQKFKAGRNNPETLSLGRRTAHVNGETIWRVVGHHLPLLGLAAGISGDDVFDFLRDG